MYVVLRKNTDLDYIRVVFRKKYTDLYYIRVVFRKKDIRSFVKNHLYIVQVFVI